MKHLTAVALGIQTLSVLTGLPSGIAFLFFGRGAIDLWLFNPGSAEPSRSEGLMKILMAMGTLFRWAAELAIGIAGWLSMVAAGLALTLLLFSIFLFLVGWGLHRHQTWARVAAGLLDAGFFLLATLVLLASEDATVRLTAVCAAGSATYVAWVLSVRYA